MTTEALARLKVMIDEQQAGNRPMVIEELGEFSPLIQDQIDKFPSLISKQQINVVSICELEMTLSVVKVHHQPC